MPEPTALEKARRLWIWARTRPFLALAIAAASAIVLGSAVDGCRQRATVRALEADLAAREESIRTIRTERDELERALEAVRKKKRGAWQAPRSLHEIKELFDALGF
jgi:septal ring factor EnvC (AmiA/AmiB activator)